MLIGRALYVLGMAFVFFSILGIIMVLLSDGGGDIALLIFALLNGLIAMGVGEMVIDLNHRRRIQKFDKE
ncbi:hypothetical protein LC048_11415 [Mesobacillus subterraneus]|uniref:hypothetical protein n=1 Tax=Mesobacillus subterraneus TaxID=285983 RepID=UPI001CFED441|nr:hypothetical protein [Mesobacillus subterraneus]WLR57402.1 hypothetical protein LC048_11415 [Mesobacillus subterraneus]